MPFAFIVLSIVLPAVCGVVSDGVTYISSRKKYGIILFSVVISNLVMLLGYCLFRSSFTTYEYLLMNAVTAILLLNLVFPLYKVKQLSVFQVLKTACYVCAAIVVYSILTRGQTLIHGDTATASILTKSQLEHRSYFPDTWYYVNGDIWVITVQNFVAPFVLLLKDQSLARVLGSAFFCATAACIMIFHSKKCFKTNCWVISVPLMFLFLAGQCDMTLYQAAYTGQIIFLILTCVLFCTLQEKSRSVWNYIVFAAYIIILLAGGIRSLAEIVASLIGGVTAYRYFSIRNKAVIDWKKFFREILHDYVVVLIPTIIGIALHLMLKNTHHLISSAHNMLIFEKSISDLIDNLFKYAANMFVCFGFYSGVSVFSIKGIMNMISICLCILVVFVIPVLQAFKIKYEGRYIQFFCAFAAVHNLIMFILAVCFTGKDESRYLLTSIFLCILVSSRYIYVYWISQNHFDKYIWTSLYVIAIIIGSVSLLLDSKGWNQTLIYKEEVTQQLSEMGLDKGYADFWTAYSHEVYSDFEIRFGGLEIYEGTPYAHYWLVDGNVFIPEDKPTFLMLTESEHQAVAPKISEIFDDPVSYLTINGYHIYIFDYDIVVDMV